MQLFDFWLWISRLGESEILLPVALAVTLILLITGRSAWSWTVPFAVAVFMTLASKVAFIGWGVGIKSLDFTGLSGHAVLSAAIYPLLGYVIFSKDKPPDFRLGGAALGFILAAMIAVSRVIVHAHSPAESLAGFALGALVSLLGMSLMRDTARSVSPVYATVVAVWLAWLPLHAPPSGSHQFVTRLALLLSQHARPFERADLYRPG